ncbi:FadR/GntR family transcriptional regulator [Shouchella clausii]|uniref:FadR/GntR family transcriptional regulator n=1 Tax=Shouchella clausii TaxID=79880 RepID=UPI000796D513|nr:FadR/GntR family transcriptional regulator [Shouchella clausii]KKI85128.1 hypothetical protein WZ76_16875 [Shouchella clausii]
MEFKSIKKRNLYEEIMTYIFDYIAEYKLRPGDKLPTENEFVQMYGVSKTAVREALSVLAAKGVIEKKSGVGSIVRNANGNGMLEPVTQKLMMEEQTLKEVLEFRRGIEVESAALAAQRATPEQIEAIENANVQLIEANERGEAGIEEDYRFHYLIILATGNSFYETMFDFIAPTFFKAMKVSKNQSKRVSDTFLKEAQIEHDDILQAIKTRDVAKARACMLDHLMKNEKKLWSNER